MFIVSVLLVRRSKDTNGLCCHLGDITLPTPLFLVLLTIQGQGRIILPHTLEVQHSHVESLYLVKCDYELSVILKAWY